MEVLSESELLHRTQHHPPKSAETIAAHEGIRAATRNFLDAIRLHCPECREKAIAVSNAEQAMMWANAAVARNQSAGD